MTIPLLETRQALKEMDDISEPSNVTLEKMTGLEALFRKWREQTATAEHHFHDDGIIDGSLWEKAPMKVCFLMKEPNNPNRDESHRKFDFREEWRKRFKGVFAKRLGLWAGGIFTDFPPPDTLDRRHRHRALRAIALVNVKKTGGSGRSNVHSLQPFAERDKALILEQLAIIDPKVIILGLSDPPVLRQLLFPEVQWHPTGYGVLVGTWCGARLIDFYHPSSHNVPSASYSLLQNVMRSETYKSLAP